MLAGRRLLRVAGPGRTSPTRPALTLGGEAGQVDGPASIVKEAAMLEKGMGWATLGPLLRTAVANTHPPPEYRPRPLLTLRGRPGFVPCVPFSPSGKHRATAARDMTAALWDASTGKRRFTLEGHTDSVRDLAFGPGGWLATGGQDGM